jgi:GAF domain-containing protein
MADEVEGEALRAENERLASELAAASARAAEAYAESEALREQLRALQAQHAAASAEAEALRADIGAAAERERAAAARYREAVLRAEPALPPDLVRGESIAEVDGSLEAARAVVTQVRARMQAEAQEARVPAGSPPRGAPDLGALTPEQKIRYGLAQRASRP